MTLVVEGSLFLIGALAGFFFNFHFQREPIREMHNWPWLSSWGPGVVGAMLLMCGAFVFGHLPFVWAKEFVDLAGSLLRKLFRNIPLPGLLLISAAAGLGEEMFFRWCLMGGLMMYVSWPLALLISSILFGVCHWVNVTYAWLATLAGAFLGVLMLLADTIVVPMIAHAVYDFFAFVWILKSNRTGSA